MEPTGICLPLWVVGAAAAPLLTAIGVLWRSLLTANNKMEARYDEILRRTYELEENSKSPPVR